MKSHHIAYAISLVLLVLNIMFIYQNHILKSETSVKQDHYTHKPNSLSELFEFAKVSSLDLLDDTFNDKILLFLPNNDCSVCTDTLLVYLNTLDTLLEDNLVIISNFTENYFKNSISPIINSSYRTINQPDIEFNKNQLMSGTPMLFYYCNKTLKYPFPIKDNEEKVIDYCKYLIYNAYMNQSKNIITRHNPETCHNHSHNHNHL